MRKFYELLSGIAGNLSHISHILSEIAIHLADINAKMGGPTTLLPKASSDTKTDAGGKALPKRHRKGGWSEGELKLLRECIEKNYPLEKCFYVLHRNGFKRSRDAVQTKRSEIKLGKV